MSNFLTMLMSKLNVLRLDAMVLGDMQDYVSMIII